MRNPHGYLTITGPEGVVEMDTMLCNHCGGIVKVPPGQNPSDVGGICKQCMGTVCPRCYAMVGCTPFEKRIERMEARARARRSYVECA